MKTEDLIVGEVYWAWLLEENEDCPKKYKILSKKKQAQSNSISPPDVWYIIKIMDEKLDVGELFLVDDNLNEYFEHFRSERFFDTEEECVDKWQEILDFYLKINDLKRAETVKKYLTPYLRLRRLKELVNN